jgi:hypothetical protein
MSYVAYDMISASAMTHGFSLANQLSHMYLGTVLQVFLTLWTLSRHPNIRDLRQPPVLLLLAEFQPSTATISVSNAC